MKPSPTTFSITIDGDPIPKGSVRVGKGRGYMPRRTREYMERAMLCMMQRRLSTRWERATGPVCLDVTFVLKRPARIKKKNSPSGRIAHTVRPDMDNLLKAIKDAATKAGIWQDDCQVTTINASKVYAAKGEGPKVEITVSHEDNPDA